MLQILPGLPQTCYSRFPGMRHPVERPDFVTYYGFLWVSPFTSPGNLPHHANRQGQLPRYRPLESRHYNCDSGTNQPLSFILLIKNFLFKRLGISKTSSSMARKLSFNHLGLCYKFGDGVKKDLKEALRYYQLASDRGYPEAQTHLGLCYENGNGVERDLKEAVRYYRLASDQGCTPFSWWRNLEGGIKEISNLRYKRGSIFDNSRKECGFILSFSVLKFECLQE